MSDEPALLAAIIADPDEDTPRLAYADWLDENGDPHRAEFIRLQIGVLRSGTPPNFTPDYVAALRKFRAFLDAHAADWAAPLGAAPHEVMFSRGFVEELTVSPATVLGRGPRGWRNEVIRVLKVIHPTSSGQPWPAGDEVLRALAALPELARLRTLRVGGLAVTAAGVAELVAGPVSGLRALDLRDNQSGLGVIAAVAASEHLTGLEYLDLGRVTAGADEVLALAQTTNLPKLRECRGRLLADPPPARGDPLRAAVAELRHRFWGVDWNWE